MAFNSKKGSAGGLELVIMRNAFYRDSYYQVLFAVLFLLIVNGFLAYIVYYKISNPPQPQYFAATADGRIIKVHPLSDPSLSDDFVVQWTADAVHKAFSWDFIHWREQMQEASNNFTPDGWRDFSASLKDSNNLKTLIDLKMVSNVEVTGSPQIIQKAVVAGHYAWNIKIPVLLSFTSVEKTINQPMNLTVIVLREPVQYYPQKIAINNLFASTSAVSAYQQGS